MADFTDDDLITAFGRLVEADRRGPAVWLALALGLTTTAGWWVVVLTQRAWFNDVTSWIERQSPVPNLVPVFSVITAVAGPALMVRALFTLARPAAADDDSDAPAGLMAGYAAQARSDRRRRILLSCAVAGVVNAFALFIVTH